MTTATAGRRRARCCTRPAACRQRPSRRGNAAAILARAVSRPRSGGFRRRHPSKVTMPKRRHPHPGRPREAEGRARVPLGREAPRGRRAHQGGARVRRHHRELRVRRRQERAGDARGEDRAAGGEAPRRRQVIDAKDLGTDVVRVGSVVHVKDEKTGKSVKYTIVGSAEANPAECKLSNESPVGKALLGHKRGEIVEVPRAPRPEAQAQDHQDRRRRVGARALSRPDELLAHAAREARAAARGRASSRSRTPIAGVEPIAVGARRARRAWRPARRPTPRYRVAGRLAARRGQGKMAFLDLVDRSGRIQLQARVDVLGEERTSACSTLDLGDLIGVDGTAFRSRARRAVAARRRLDAAGQVAAPAARRSTTACSDVETRYRQRELDLIANEETRDAVRRARAGDRGGPPLPRRRRASSRSRRRCCSRSTAARWRGRSPRTTTRSTARCTCASPPSCTSSG